MTLDRFGRHIHHHEAHADEIYLVKDVTDLKTDLCKEFLCSSITPFMLHSTSDYFLQFNNNHSFLWLIHIGRVCALIIEGYKKNLVYFVNGKAFTDIADLYVEKLLIFK